MHRLLRFTLTWLLVLALPAQGYAAQAMLFCGPVHSAAAFDSAAATATGHDHAAHGHAAFSMAGAAEAHRHGAPSAHASQGGHPHGIPADADGQNIERQQASTHDTHAKADATGTGELSSAKCSVCAACCSMAAIAGAIGVPATLSFPPVYTVSPFEPHASLTAGGLERPPKHYLA